MTSVHATIARVNGHGLQTKEDPGKWWNISKYATPAPAIPPAGTEVTLTIDGSGFVRHIESASVQPIGPNIAPDAPGSTERPEGSPGTIDTRLACLTAAATFLAPRAEAKSTDVVALAERFLAWSRGS